jgi:hypothetical protein
LVAFHALSFGVRPASPVARHLVQLDHLLNAFLVLLFHTELEFELRQHELDSRTEMLCIGFNQI